MLHIFCERHPEHCSRFRALTCIRMPLGLNRALCGRQLHPLFAQRHISHLAIRMKAHPALLRNKVVSERPSALQTASVAVTIVALLLINFIKPWYSSDAATDLLGAIFEVAPQPRHAEQAAGAAIPGCWWYSPDCSPARVFALLYVPSIDKRAPAKPDKAPLLDLRADVRSPLPERRGGGRRGAQGGISSRFYCIHACCSLLHVIWRSRVAAAPVLKRTCSASLKICKICLLGSI